MLNPDDYRVRMADSVMWIVLKKNGDGKFRSFAGTPEPTHEERARWEATISSRRPHGVWHPDGYFDEKDCYRCEADEAAVLARWLGRSS